jgi:hypothetical protein
MSFASGIPAAGTRKKIKSRNRPNLAMRRLSHPEEGHQADYRGVQATTTHFRNRYWKEKICSIFSLRFQP